MSHRDNFATGMFINENDTDTALNAQPQKIHMNYFNRRCTEPNPKAYPPSMLSIPSRPSAYRQSGSSTTAAEIQRWKAQSLDNEYLCREDVLKEYFFWNLIQCQKDQLYNFYVEEEARLIDCTTSWTEVAKASLKDTSSQAVLNSHIVHLTFLLEQVHMFQEFIRAREDDFIEVLNAYDKCHGTNVRPSELYELRTTHSFLKGQRLNELEAEIKESILPLEEAVDKMDSSYGGISRHGGPLGRSLKRSSVLFGPGKEQSIKSINTRFTERTRNSITSTNGGCVPLEEEISENGDEPQDRHRLRGSYRRMKGRMRASFRRIFKRSNTM